MSFYGNTAGNAAEGGFNSQRSRTTLPSCVLLIYRYKNTASSWLPGGICPAGCPAGCPCCDWSTRSHRAAGLPAPAPPATAPNTGMSHNNGGNMQRHGCTFLPVAGSGASQVNMNNDDHSTCGMAACFYLWQVRGQQDDMNNDDNVSWLHVSTCGRKRSIAG